MLLQLSLAWHQLRVINLSDFTTVVCSKPFCLYVFLHNSVLKTGCFLCLLSYLSLIYLKFVSNVYLCMCLNVIHSM